MESRPDLIDRLMESYADWRKECAELWVAYEHWSRVPVPERPRAFATYRAALDREECACGVYTDLACARGERSPDS